MLHSIIISKMISLEPIKVSLITSSNLLRLYCASSIATRKKNLYSPELDKNIPPQRASLELHGTLASINNFQLSGDQGERCYQYKPSEKIIFYSKKVTWKYNKERSSETNEK